jgi:2-polyprenyl-3-methyl-5-hydroxy-6-metoxy-1,4-benzoquinol methylase
MVRTVTGICAEANECIACGKSDLVQILDLGVQPLANSFKKTQTDKENFYPLRLNMCKNCSHLQLSHMVHPDELFKHYLYVSGTSKTQLEYFNWFSKMVSDKIQSNSGKVLDIGCNDGSQLDYFKSIGFQTYGIDPAVNLHSISSNKHDVVCDYFNEDHVVFSEKFNAIICQNAFAHNYDQLQFLEKCKSILADDGLLFITISQALMILNNEFDTIYHEHYSYYNVKSMDTLCKRAGVFLVDVIAHPIHGTSYIFVISTKNTPSNTVKKMIEDERLNGLHELGRYQKYSSLAKKIAEEFNSTVNYLKNKGYTLIGYGSPAKGNTMLNFSGVVLDFIVDDNPMKQNMFTPGTSIPIYGIDSLDKYKDSDSVCFIPLAWNFFEEISKKISSKRENIPTTYIRYFPFVETVIL